MYLIAIDFDNTIHSYTSGWKGLTEIPDAPSNGAFATLYMLLDDPEIKVAIHSSRSTPTGIIAMKQWFLKHGWPEDQESPGDPVHLQFPTTKPSAFVSIDDRALTFNGRWDFYTPERLKNFIPWRGNG